MRILLGNTGRGGELAAFTSVIKAYSIACPDAHIKVVTCHNTVYPDLFKNSPDIDEWDYLRYRKYGSAGKVVRSPVAAWLEYRKQHKHYDRVEYCCEGDLSPAFNNNPVKTVIENLYQRLKHKPFQLSDIPRKVFIYPSDEAKEHAERIHQKYGDSLVLVSHKANSANPMMGFDGFQHLCDILAKNHPVAYTGNRMDPKLEGHIDLRGVPFSTIYALSEKLNYYVGPDTATTWIVSGMPGTLVSLRGDKVYPVKNTGLCANGYRKPDNTHEINVAKMGPPAIIDQITGLLK